MWWWRRKRTNGAAHARVEQEQKLAAAQRDLPQIRRERARLERLSADELTSRTRRAFLEGL